ncbi:O-antigen ligase family protein [Polynucleobacter sp. HIN5]|uniref:O-antigen ligase family protein n=1 Tax=Polynucleobacter sp. HIN5 TaxID=3047864 RepID=UPI00257307AE|nr:O-antigen ligase family protein [Polynucleobacter sp. HIN5]
MHEFFTYLLNFSLLVIIPSFILYFVDIYFYPDTSFTVTAFHLKNIFGLPVLEGIFNPVNTIFFAALVLFTIITKPNLKFGLYYLFLIAISFATIFLSTKRSGLLYLFELLLFVFFIQNNKKHIYIFTLLVIILIFIFSVNFDFLILGGSLENSFFDSRNHIFISLTDMFYESPLFGFGLGYHNFGYHKYSQFSSTDSTYVSFLIDTGVFGFIFFIMWVFRFLYTTFKLSIKTSDYRFIAILILYFSCALFSDIMNNPSSGFILFMAFFSFTTAFSFLNSSK